MNQALRKFGGKTSQANSTPHGSGERLPMLKKCGVWVFELPLDAPKVSSRQVKDMLDGDDEFEQQHQPA